MAHYSAEIHWARGDATFTDQKYSRQHQWHFDGGIEVVASSSPSVVPLPYSVAAAVDPEEAFVASLSSCHLLWFLSLAAAAGWVVDSYVDRATGVLAKDAAGKLAMTEVTLHPAVVFRNDPPPDAQQLAALHHAAHEACFIANSVKTAVRIEPVV